MALALITGATGGIGRAVSAALAGEGFDLFITGTSHQPLKELAAFLHTQFPERSFEYKAGDLSKQTFIERLFKDHLSSTKLTAVVNNAGVSLGSDIFETSLDDWNLSMAVNLTAPFLITQYSLPIIKKSGGGAIVNIGSLAAVQGAKKPGYAASKSGLIGLTKSAAVSAGKDNIRVNAIIPGAVDTELISDWDKEKRAAVSEQSPLKRIAEAEEIASVVSYLLSDKAAFITGATINATGGTYLGY